MCGIVGVIGRPGAAKTVLDGLSTIQGRGSQAAGLAGIVESEVKVVKVEGPAGRIRKRIADTGLETATLALGHVRYGTSGGSLLANAHPFASKYEQLALAHNGQIYGAEARREILKAEKDDFEATSDSEVVLKMLERTDGEGIIDRLLKVLNQLDRAYAFGIIWNGHLIGACDPLGMHPLSLGYFENDGGGYILASEDVAIRSVGAKPIKTIDAGQVVVITPTGDVQTFRLENIPSSTRHCDFNLDYTANPASCLWGRSVTKVRIALGLAVFQEMLEQEVLPTVDVISPIPDSGRSATLAFANAYARNRMLEMLRQDGIDAFSQMDLGNLFPFNFAVNRSHDFEAARRNFQLATQDERELAIILKHGIDPAVVAGKRILLGDDSIVRATTAIAIVKKLRQEGALAVHLVSFAPPIVKSCTCGGTETKDENLLVAVNHSPEEIRQIIGVDSLHYLSLRKYREVIGSGYCMGCMSKALER
ncbi:MAG: hypothetical protein RB292_01390 [Patescibacteria group bacterium]|jgi:amidophosphoribosyltransferase|nr:hypothetical protein [Patescibacteria group bacterium]